MELDNCFVCGVQFDQTRDGGPKEWPGTIFEATGNWGSTVFDPTPSEQPASLKIRVCDACVIERKSMILQEGDSLSDDVRSDVRSFCRAKMQK